MNWKWLCCLDSSQAISAAMGPVHCVSDHGHNICNLKNVSTIVVVWVGDKLLRYLYMLIHGGANASALAAQGCVSPRELLLHESFKWFYPQIICFEHSTHMDTETVSREKLRDDGKIHPLNVRVVVWRAQMWKLDRWMRSTKVCEWPNLAFCAKFIHHWGGLFCVIFNRQRKLSMSSNKADSRYRASHRTLDADWRTARSTRPGGDLLVSWLKWTIVFVFRAHIVCTHERFDGWPPCKHFPKQIPSSPTTCRVFDRWLAHALRRWNSNSRDVGTWSVAHHSSQSPFSAFVA